MAIGFRSCDLSFKGEFVVQFERYGGNREKAITKEGAECF